MIHLAPFDSVEIHEEYCEEAGIYREEGAVGFKIFSDEEKLGLCQIKFVGEAAYILNLTAIQNRISVQMLANVFTSVVEFLRRVEIESIVYPIQSEDDVMIVNALGFDKVGDTLYVFDFPKETVCEEEHAHSCSCDHHKQ